MRKIAVDYTIKIGGEAGQGIQTIGETLGRVFVRTGYHVFSHQDYESRVRGGHNFYQIRFCDKPIAAPRETVDILVALDGESIARHERELSKNGQVIYDASAIKQKMNKPTFFDVPCVELAEKHAGNKIMANTVATGAVLGMLGMDVSILLSLLEDTFRKKGDDVINANREAAQAGHAYALDQCMTCSYPLKGDTAVRPADRMLISGIDGIGLGAIASGCKFYAAYPMTPSTGIMNFLADKAKEFGIIVEQAEDEIAAINMALGASFAGVRSMTGTSGGGFALMVEGLSLAGMTETPVVIGLGQRPGPATGFPTRTEQGELQFLISAGHGEFPRVIFAPGTPRQAMSLTNKAFDLAEKYQIPAFLLFDQHLADSQWTYDGFDLKNIRYQDYRLRGEVFRNVKEYKRHAFTRTGVTPLGIPGDGAHLVVTDSDEHDEEGHIVEDAATRISMTEKRLFKKLPLIQQEMAPPFLYGDHKPDIVITGWGSNYGVMKETVDELSHKRSIAMLHFSELFPMPLTKQFDYLRLLENAKVAIALENNATGQFARLMRAETGYQFTSQVLKYDGRPFTVEGLMGELNGHLKRL